MTIFPFRTMNGIKTAQLILGRPDKSRFPAAGLSQDEEE